LILLFFGVLMGALDISIVGPAIPSIEESMQVTERDLSWIFSIYVLFNLIGIPLMAKLSDIHGRRALYIISVSIFGVGSLMVSVAHDVTLLLIGRAVQGIGSAGIFPVATAVIGDVFPVEKRGRALGLIGAVFGIAFIIGPFIAGTMLLYFDWNALFLINLPIAVLLIAGAAWLLPGRPGDEKHAIDWAGIMLLAVVLSSFTLLMNNLDITRLEESLGSWSVLPFLMLVLILTPILVMYEQTQKESILNIHLFKSLQIRIIGFVAFGVGLFQSSIVFLPLLAVELFGVGPSEASFMLLPLVAATALGSPVSGRLLDKTGSRVIILTGLIISAAALFLFSMLSRQLWLFYTAEALLGLGLAMRASLNYVMLNEVSAKDRASTQGMLIIFISIGQLTGAGLIGAISAAGSGGTSAFGLAFLLMALLAGALFVLSFFLKKRSSEVAKETPSDII
jgi:MFS family permease